MNEPLDLFAGERLELRNAWIALSSHRSLESYKRQLLRASPDDVVRFEARRTLDEPPYGAKFAYRRIGQATVADVLAAIDLAESRVDVSAWSLAGYLRDRVCRRDPHAEPW